MKININPIYLEENGHFWKSLKDLVVNGTKYTGQKFKGTKKYIPKNFNDPQAKDIAIGKIWTDIYNKVLPDEKGLKYLDSIDSYLGARNSFRDSSRKFGEEVKNLPRRSLEGIKDAGEWIGNKFKKKPRKKITPTYINSSELPLAAGSIGLGIYGAKATIDDLA